MNNTKECDWIADSWHIRAPEAIRRKENSLEMAQIKAITFDLWDTLIDDDSDEPKRKAKGLRTKKAERRHLVWEALNQGVIDCIATDHACHTFDEKTGPDPPSGVPGLETGLPLLLDAVHKKKITLGRVAELTSQNPARIFGLKKKGVIAK